MTSTPGLIRDRLSWMRFLRFDLGGPTPDENTIRHFCVPQAAGILIGMPATKAQILVPGLIVQDADPVEDGAALERLALWVLQRFATIVAPASMRSGVALGLHA